MTDLLQPAQAIALKRGRQVVRMHGRVETVARVETAAGLVRITTVAGNEWFCHPDQLHDVLPLRYYGIVEKGLSHATKPDPEIFNGFAQAACNGKLWISVEHTLNDEPVLAVLGWPLFGEGDNAHVMIGNSPDCNRCRRIMGE